MLHGDAEGTSRMDMARWWEARRVRYNLLVGIVGVASWLLVLFAGSAAVKPRVDFEEPVAMIVGPFFYAAIANICYTGGTIFGFLRGGKNPARRLFALGLFFSLGLTALPGLWALFCSIRSVVTGQKMD
jgi:hypothetical protein